MGKKFTAAEIAEAITKSEGFLSPAAKMLGCSTKTIQRYIADFPSIAEAQHEAKFRRDDFVEAQIMKRIKAGSDTMIIFYAKTQMKGRGYIERSELIVDTPPDSNFERALKRAYGPSTGNDDPDQNSDKDP